MRRLRRARRPLIALVALVLLLVIGYAVKGCDRSDGSAAGVGHSAVAPLTHTGGRALSASLR